MRLAPGTTFDRYVIGELLGEGGMGEVYRATDPRLERDVALKVLCRRSEGDAQAWTLAVARMQREARAAAALCHANTVAVYDVGEHDGTPFIAMELVEGQSLRALVGKDAPLAVRISILRDVARALSAAHRDGLIHRDIKPENVMVRRDGVVKVLDFGIARRVQAGGRPARTAAHGAGVTVGDTLPEPPIDPGAPTIEGVVSTLTAPGDLVGTPAYMAPEQVRGGDLDARVDQFAWGVLAYELLSGELPFRTDKGMIGLIASIMSDAAPPIAGIPERVDAVVRRALSKEPGDRHASMDEIADALGAFVGGESPMPPADRRADPEAAPAPTRDTPGEPQTGWPARRRASIAAAIAAVIALVVFAGLNAFVPRRPVIGQTTGAPAASPSAAPPVAPTAITDLPQPASSKPEALLAYREGVQALRDGSWEVARTAFRRARDLDPALAEAHLRYGLATHPYDAAEGRDAFQKAILLRSSLGERDQALIDALAPYVQRDPPDRQEARKRLDALSRRFPGDAEIALWRAFVSITEPEATLPLADACLALDPLYADCWLLKAVALTLLGKTEEALATYDACIQRSVMSADCVAEKAMLDRSTGRCEDLERAARRLVTLTPNEGRPNHQLAVALLALGRSPEAVRTTLERATAQLRAAGDTLLPRIMEVELAVALGDFDPAERRLLDLGISLGEPSVVLWQPDAPLYLAQLYEEMGRSAEAGRAAAEFIARKDALAPPDARPWQDRTLELCAIQARARLLPRAQCEAERTARLSRRVAGATPAQREEAWYTAYAMPARTAAEAREALAALPDLAPLPHHLPATHLSRGDMLLGKLHFLAGDMQAALPHLGRFVAGCDALVQPFAYLQSAYRLGAAREALGDREGACAAYGLVLSRWGASGRSVTAKAASRKSRALGCRS